MEAFSALLALCAGNSPVSGELPAQRPVTRSFEVFFDLHLIKLLSKHARGWWFETLSCSLWRHRNETTFSKTLSSKKIWLCPTENSVLAWYWSGSKPSPVPCMYYLVNICSKYVWNRTVSESRASGALPIHRGLNEMAAISQTMF